MKSHYGAQNTYDVIADWYDCPFPFSKNLGWGRYGILGVLGDLILQGVNGDILEVGVGESSIYLGKLADKYNRIIYYCDIAQGKIENPSTVKGYLSENSVKFIGSSDRLFKEVPIPLIALAYLDGDHHYEQAKKDFWNLVPYVVDDGVIFLHDTYPAKENQISEHRCGSVYKLRQELEKSEEFDCFTFTRTVGCGVGMTMCRKLPKNRKYFQQ